MSIGYGNQSYTYSGKVDTSGLYGSDRFRAAMKERFGHGRFISAFRPPI
jgi:hypothetical protein